MYKDARLKTLQNIQSKVFEALEKFITYYNTEVDKGQYLFFIEKVNDCITLKVGTEKFTINSQIYLKEKKIIFQVYALIFDVSKIERYRHDHIQDLDFYCDDTATVKYFKAQFDDDTQRDFDLIMPFSHFGFEKYLEPFFNQLEKYTDKRLELS